MPEHDSESNRMVFTAPPHGPSKVGGWGLIFVSVVIVVWLTCRFVQFWPLWAILQAWVILVGLDLLLPEEHAEIDLQAGTARSWKRKWVLFHRVSDVPLAAVTHVAVDTHTVKDLPVARVYLLARNSGILTLRDGIDTDDELVARRLAEQVSLACGLPLMDRTTGRALVRDAEDLELGHAGRLARDGVERDLPPAPASVGCSYEIDGDTVSIHARPVGTRLKDWLAVVLLGLGMACLAAFYVFSNERSGGWWLIAAAVGAGLCMGTAAGVMLVRARMRHTWVEVSPEGITVTARAPGWSRTWRVDAEVIEEFVIVPHGGIPGLLISGPSLLLQGGGERVQFGHGLDPEELSWIRDVADLLIAGRLAPVPEARVAARAGDGDPMRPPGHDVTPGFATGPSEMVRTRTWLRIPLLLAVLCGTGCSLLLAYAIHEPGRREEARLAEECRRIEREVREFQHDMKKFDRTMTEARVSLKKELVSLQPRLLDALYRGDSAFLDELWIPDEVARNLLNRAPAQNGEVRKQAKEAIAGFARLVGELPDASSVDVISPQSDGTGPQSSGEHTGVWTTLGRLGRLGFRLTSSGGGAWRLDMDFFKYKRCYLINARLSRTPPSSSPSSAPAH